MAISYIHYPKGSIIGSGPTAYRHYGDETPPYDYGDGSRIMIEQGYNSILYLNGTKLTTLASGYKYGNCMYPLNKSLNTTIIDSASGYNNEVNVMQYTGTGASNNTYAANTFTHTAYNGEYTFCYYWHGGTWCAGTSIQDFKLIVDGSGYTLSQCVSNGYIKPLVVTQSVNTDYRYCWFDVRKIYDNSGPTRGTIGTYGQFVSGTLHFMTNSGHNFTGATFNAVWAEYSKTGQYKANDGLKISACPIASYRFTLNAY